MSSFFPARTQALAILFSPRVIIVVIGIIFLLMLGVGALAYYVYKR